MKPDLLVCWIKHCDYPIFRQFLKKYRNFFGKAIIYWSEHHRHMYYDKFIEEDLKDFNITFLQNIEYKYGIEDWRNIATNEMLKYSDSEWVCSIEQDWFCKDWDIFFKWIETYKDLADLFGWMNLTTNPYIHPACFFIKKELLNKTSKDFSPHPEIVGSDHFAQITYDANKLEARVRNLPLNMNVEPNADCFHLGGVNQNYLEGLKEGIRQVESV